MFGLSEWMSAETYAVSPGGESTDDHVRVPMERILANLSNLLSVSPPQFGSDLGTADFQHRFLPSCAVICA
jgi:hypothetical protein